MTPADVLTSRQSAAARCLAIAQVLTGVALALRPRDVARLAAGSTGTAPADGVVRALGVRLLGQGAALLARPTRGTEFAGVAIDGAHGISMFAVAAASSRYRRAALVSGWAAAASAAAAAYLAAAAPRAAALSSSQRP